VTQSTLHESHPAIAGGGLTVAQPRTRKVVGRVGSPAKERHPIHVAPTNGPGSGDAPTGVLRETRFGCVPPVAPEHRWERGDRITDSAAIQDPWYVLARAGTDGASRTPAAAQDAVFRRYLPMARTLANGPGDGGRPGDPADAEQAAELGLAQAVLGWRRPDSGGFEVFARSAIASRPRRRPTGNPGDPPPGGWPTAGDAQSPDPGY